MSGQHIHQAARLQGPHEDLEGIQRTSANNLTAAVHRQTGELHRVGGGQRAEILVAQQIMCTHGTIETRTN